MVKTIESIDKRTLIICGVLILLTCILAALWPSRNPISQSREELDYLADYQPQLSTMLAFRRAEEKWISEEYDVATKMLLKGVWHKLEGSVRGYFARMYIKDSLALFRDGELSQAAEACNTAIRILGRYDDEGGISHWCYTIDVHIQYPDLYNQ